MAGNSSPGLFWVDTLAPGVPRVGAVGAPDLRDWASISAPTGRGTRFGTGEAADRC
jgi:hypothetical protein